MKITSRYNLLSAAVIFSLSSAIQDVSAQEEDTFGAISLEALFNIEVVSATRSESKLSESPVPISVITAKEIASSGLDNIPDILARLPEIDVLHVGRSQTEVSIRGKGINFNRRLLVLIDGRTEYNDLFGVTLWHAFPVAVDDIERIEVVRGPASALFGANAYSGVINIITKRADAEDVRVARVHMGDHGTSYANLAANYVGEGASIKVSYTRQSADSVITDVPFQGFNRIRSTVNFHADDKSLDGMQRLNISGIIDHSEKWNLQLNAGMSDGTLELFQQPGLPREKWDVETQNLHGIFNWIMSDTSSFQFNIYQNTFEYSTGLVPRRAVQEVLSSADNGFFYPISDHVGNFNGKAETLDYAIQFVGQALDGRMNWVLGAERRDIENNGGIVANSEKDISSAFGNFTLKLTDELIMGMGLREDDDSITGADIGYNSSLQYSINETDSVRFTARKAFRAPSLFELFSSVDLPVPNQNQQVNFRGNLDLDVESIRSLDVTYTAQIGSDMQLTFEIFKEKYGQIIGNPDSGILDEVELTDTGLLISTTSFQNLANAESKGFQAGLVWLASQDLKTYLNYRYADPDGLNSVSGETFFTPENTIKMGGTWEISDTLTADFSYQYISKTDSSEFLQGDVSPDGPSFTRDNQESYDVLNISLHYKPESIEGLKVYLVGDNLLDSDHVEYYEYDQVLKGVGERAGRTIWGGVSWSF